MDNGINYPGCDRTRKNPILRSARELSFNVLRGNDRVVPNRFPSGVASASGFACSRHHVQDLFARIGRQQVPILQPVLRLRDLRTFRQAATPCCVGR